MIKKAVEEVYLRTEFDEAEKILTGTIEACEYKCKQSTLARAWMYTGIVRGSGKQDQEGAYEAFVAALETDPKVELDRGLATAETQETWERAEATRAPASDEPEPTETDPPAGVAPGPPIPGSDREVCPPGLPACADEGDRCQESVECKNGLVCGKAAGATGKTCNAPERCQEDADCGAGACVKGLCEARDQPVETPSKNWLGLHGAWDMALLPEARRICTAESDAAGDYVCSAGGEPYTREPSSTGRESNIRGGMAPATGRVLLSFDHAFGAHVQAGLRAGLAFGGAERGFLPIHGELRGRYLFGSSILSPFVSASVGIAQVDAAVAVTMPEDVAGPTSAEAQAAFGRFFGAGGLGLLFVPSDGIRFELSLNAVALFPSIGFVVEPSAGVSLPL